jgi:hypothetical protein
MLARFDVPDTFREFNRPVPLMLELTKFVRLLVPAIFRDETESDPTFAVPVTLIVGSVLIDNPEIFAVPVTFRVLITACDACRVPVILRSDGNAKRSKESFAILSYTYAEFLRESDILGITW